MLIKSLVFSTVIFFYRAVLSSYACDQPGVRLLKREGLKESKVSEQLRCYGRVVYCEILLIFSCKNGRGSSPLDTFKFKFVFSYLALFLTV